MEKYEITKEQVLQISLHDQIVEELLNEWFPDAFKKELEVGKWYKGIKHNFLVNYQGNGDLNYGFWGNSRFKNDIFFGEYWFDECLEATPEEVEEALENEVIKRFGKDWPNAKIEKCLVHGNTNRNFIIAVTNYQIWNKNGCIYNNGVFAEPLKNKVISIGNELIAEAKKRGYKKGVSCIFGKAEEKRILETDDFMLSTDNELCVKRFNSMTSDIIFRNGKWAKIIPEETKVITMEKAVKMLSKKYGKQVEIK